MQKYTHFGQTFKKIYQKEYCAVVLEIAYQNPWHVSKFERDMIINLRLLVLIEIFTEYGSEWSIAKSDEIWLLLYHTCLDQNVEIRMALVNFLVSRFKLNDFNAIRSEKLRIMVLLTAMSIY